MAPIAGVICHEFAAAGRGRSFFAWSIKFRANARYEITEIIAEQHDDPVGFGDVQPSGNLRAIPALLVGQHDMCLVSLDPDLVKLLDDGRLLWARVRIVVKLCAGSVRNEEHGDSSLPGGSHERRHAPYGSCVVRLKIVVHFPVAERALECQLKIDVADYGFIDVENYGWRKVSSMLLLRHCAPRLVIDKSG